MGCLWQAHSIHQPRRWCEPSAHSHATQHMHACLHAAAVNPRQEAHDLHSSGYIAHSIRSDDLTKSCTKIVNKRELVRTTKTIRPAKTVKKHKNIPSTITGSMTKQLVRNQILGGETDEHGSTHVRTSWVTDQCQLTLWVHFTPFVWLSHITSLQFTYFLFKLNWSQLWTIERRIQVEFNSTMNSSSTYNWRQFNH